jgi:hypothetical protein
MQSSHTRVGTSVLESGECQAPQWLQNQIHGSLIE